MYLLFEVYQNDIKNDILSLYSSFLEIPLSFEWGKKNLVIHCC